MKTINYEEEHRKLWNWLADHPEAKKADYFKNWSYNSIPRSYCFACEFMHREADRTDTYPTCTCCPLGGPHIVCGPVGLYTKWQRAASPEDRQQLALQIAKLPWK